MTLTSHGVSKDIYTKNSMRISSVYLFLGLCLLFGHWPSSTQEDGAALRSQSVMSLRQRGYAVGHEGRKGVRYAGQRNLMGKIEIVKNSPSPSPPPPSKTVIKKVVEESPSPSPPPPSKVVIKKSSPSPSPPPPSKKVVKKVVESSSTPSPPPPSKATLKKFPFFGPFG